MAKQKNYFDFKSTPNEKRTDSHLQTREDTPIVQIYKNKKVFYFK